MRSLEHLSSEFEKRHSAGESWKDIADDYGINKAMARLIAMGFVPGKKIRKALDLAPSAMVVVIAGEVPPGAQIIGTALMCECGQYFIQNHPARKRCFICSPYHKRGKHG